MAYIGKEPAVGNFQVCDAISVVNGQAAYTMQVSSTNVTPESANHMLVSLNGILQKPNSSFTVSGSTITFASNLATGDVIDFIMLLGNVLDIGTPSDSTVTDAKANFVSTSSGAGLQIKGDGTTDGTLQLNCSQNSHGVKIASPAHSAGQSYTLTLPTGNVTADKFLKVASVSGSGTTGIGQLSFADAGGNTPSFSAVVSTDTSLGTSNTLVPFDVELYDSDNCYTNTSGNYKFTPNVAGKYYIGSNMYGSGLDDQDQVFWSIYFNGNQSAYNASWSSTSQSNRAMGAFVGAVLEFDGVDDYVQIYCHSTQSSFTIDNGGYSSTSVYTKQLSASNFFGYKLIGV